MQSHYEIPDTFWSLFRSVNREIYIESLLCINQEYEYSNYFLTREVCLQILSDRNTQKRIRLEREESETELDPGDYFFPDSELAGEDGLVKKN